MPGSVWEIILQKANKIWKSLVRPWFAIFLVHQASSQCFDKTPEVTCAGRKRERFRRHVIHKSTQMYLFIQEPVCDTVDNRLGHFKTRAAAKDLARVNRSLYLVLPTSRLNNRIQTIIKMLNCAFQMLFHSINV